jgi:hypothetical protein
MSPANSTSSAGRIVKPAGGKGYQQSNQAKINARLERLEKLLMQVLPAVGAHENIPNSVHEHGEEGSDREDLLADPRNGLKSSSHGPTNGSSSGRTVLNRNGKPGKYNSEDDTLLVQSGHTHFVSAQHWALLADEVGFLFKNNYALG